MKSELECGRMKDRRVGPYTLSDDPGRIDTRAIHAYLTRSYWSAGIPLELVVRAVRGSLCIGAYDSGGPGAYDSGGPQVGLVRLVSDYATFCYVCDVYVLEEHRGQGLSKAMLGMAMDHPSLQGLRRWSLVTADAHGLYRQLGFEAVAQPERHMERVDPEVYRQYLPPPGRRR